MASVEERLSYLEGKVEEQSRGFNRNDERFNRIDERFNRVDERFDQLELRIEALNQKIDGVFYSLDQKISRQFFWLAGFQLTTPLAIIGFLGRLTFP